MTDNPPASDWRKPSSTFARNQKRSMASSSVASSGNASIASSARCFSFSADMLEW
jgi:hypothetical protein